MLYENIKNIVDVREQSFIATKHFNDKDVIDLIEYMLLKDAIIDRLILTEGSLTKEGVEFIVTKYSHKLQELDISDNGLTDVDIESLLHLPSKSSLRTLSINNNFLSKDSIAALEQCGFEYLDTSDQNQQAQMLKHDHSEARDYVHNTPFYTSLTTAEDSGHNGKKRELSMDVITNNPDFLRFVIETIEPAKREQLLEIFSERYEQFTKRSRTTPQKYNN
jgi:Ran GTPase-activating protein (RanGAP) involved in mRNA processing and transport